MIMLPLVHGNKNRITSAQQRCNNQQRNKQEPHRNDRLFHFWLNLLFYIRRKQKSRNTFSYCPENKPASNFSHMPELPDLQVFGRSLSEKLVGKRVQKIRAIYRKKLKTSDAELRDRIERATLTSIYRDGKELRFAFDNGHVLGLHMMLKGELHLFVGTHDKKYPIIEILFSDGSGLVMTDWQGQARATLNPEPREAPDALSPMVNYRFLKEKLASSRAAIKKLLMDQEVIRGIGNAYADEILWDARISPLSICNKIPQEVVKQLAKSIRRVLTKAEKAIFKAYPGITAGEIRDFMAVHNPDRTHSPTGERIHIQKAGRSTYYTDEQKLYT
jgi:formamidopyrimidine-DNA glycosylase